MINSINHGIKFHLISSKFVICLFRNGIQDEFYLLKNNVISSSRMSFLLELEYSNKSLFSFIFFIFFVVFYYFY